LVHHNEHNEGTTITTTPVTVRRRHYEGLDKGASRDSDVQNPSCSL
jgi:hypothetical protein